MAETRSVDPEQEWMEAMGRAGVYTFLTRALAFPTTPSRDEIEARLIPFVGRIQLPEPCGNLLKRSLDARRAPLDELVRAHGRVFTPVESQDCPSYETAFVPGDVFRQAHTMADVAGFYRAHGLAVGGVDRVRPDHIAAEMEFMGFMARKEAHAIRHLTPGRVKECRKTQRSFLTEHLGRWGPAFGRRLATIAEDPFFGAIGGLIAEWLELDMATMMIEPIERLDQPVPQAEPDDGSCGLELNCGLDPMAREPAGRDV
ncbi:MAG: molecular chaperone TorD family protein [Actinomycetota bacterium]